MEETREALRLAALAITLLQRGVDPGDSLEVLQDAVARLRLVHRNTNGRCWLPLVTEDTAPPCVVQGEE